MQQVYRYRSAYHIKASKPVKIQTVVFRMITPCSLENKRQCTWKIHVILSTPFTRDGIDAITGSKEKICES
jgi:hypothetical protein